MDVINRKLETQELQRKLAEKETEEWREKLLDKVKEKIAITEQARDRITRGEDLVAKFIYHQQGLEELSSEEEVSRPDGTRLAGYLPIGYWHGQCGDLHSPAYGKTHLVPPSSVDSHADRNVQHELGDLLPQHFAGNSYRHSRHSHIRCTISALFRPYISDFVTNP